MTLHAIPPNVLKRVKALEAAAQSAPEEGIAPAGATQLVLATLTFSANQQPRLTLGGLRQFPSGLVFTPPATIAWGEALAEATPWLVEIGPVVSDPGLRAALASQAPGFGGDLVNGNQVRVDTVAEMVALPLPRDKAQVSAAGYHSAHDGGADTFRYDAAAAEGASSQIIVPAGGIGRYKRVRKTYKLLNVGLIPNVMAESVNNRAKWLALMDEIRAAAKPAHVIVSGADGPFWMMPPSVGNNRHLCPIQSINDLIVEGECRYGSGFKLDHRYDFTVDQPDCDMFGILASNRISLRNFYLDGGVYTDLYPYWTTTLSATAAIGANSVTLADPAKVGVGRSIKINLDGGAFNIRTVTAKVGAVVSFSGAGLTAQATAGNACRIDFNEQMHGVRITSAAIAASPGGPVADIELEHLFIRQIRGDGVNALGDPALGNYIDGVNILDTLIENNDRSGTAWQRGNKNITHSRCTIRGISDSCIDSEITGGVGGIDGFRVLHSRLSGNVEANTLSLGGLTDTMTRVSVIGNDILDRGVMIVNVDGLVFAGNTVTGGNSDSTTKPLRVIGNLKDARFEGGKFTGRLAGTSCAEFQTSTTRSNLNLRFAGNTWDNSVAVTDVFEFQCPGSDALFEGDRFIGNNGAGQSGLKIRAVPGWVEPANALGDIRVRDIAVVNCGRGVSLITTFAGVGIPVRNVSIDGITLSNVTDPVYLDSNGATLPFPGLRVSNVPVGASGNVVNNQTTGGQFYFLRDGGGAGVSTFLVENSICVRGDCTLGSNVVTNCVFPTGPTLQVGAGISGTGIPGGATITAVNVGAGTVTISANATSTGAGRNLSVAITTPENNVPGSIGSRVIMYKKAAAPIFYGKEGGAGLTTSWVVK